METLVNKIKENIDLFVANAEAQVAKGNKAAGARARKAALDLMKDLNLPAGTRAAHQRPHGQPP